MSEPGVPRVLAVDVGNSAVKLLPFTCASDGTTNVAWDDCGRQGSELIVVPVRDLLASPGGGADTAVLESLVRQLPPAPQQWYAVSVHRTAAASFRAWLAKVRPQDAWVLLEYDLFGLPTDLPDPQRVGTDRLAAAVAANQGRRPDRAAIVIDAGTAVTVDLVTADGVYRGGAILPGMRTAAGALTQATDALPLIDPASAQRPPEPVGKSTRAALEAGIFWGCIGGVRELVQRMAASLPDPPDLFCTGGDGERIAQWLSPQCQFDPYLVLRGVAITACRLPGGWAKMTAPHVESQM